MTNYFGFVNTVQSFEVIGDIHVNIHVSHLKKRQKSTLRQKVEMKTREFYCVV